MIRVVVGVFLLLHSLVHLLYFGQSARRFELRPGMLWPDGSLTFSKLLGDDGTRTLANILLILAAAGFFIGGVGVFFGLSWWRPVVVGSASLSAILYILFWNGRWHQLPDQGGIGLLIDGAILAAVLIFR